ncbi:MAG: hypothetical protein ABW194_07175 [Novosphingobium sp.]
MIGAPASRRLVTAAAAALLGVACWGSAVDRLSARNPALATFVPRPFAAAADRARAATALGEGRIGAAIAAGRRAVASDPIDPLATSLLGTALLLAGRWDAAEAAMRVSAQGGWRTAATQLYWAEVALGAGEHDLAAQRIDAVLRQNPDLPTRNALLARLETTAAGRDALARRLALHPGWRDGYGVQFAEIAATQARWRTDVLLRLGRAGHPLGCVDAIPPVASLASIDRQAARVLWRQHCPRARSGALVADGSFDWADPSRPGSPFEWQFPAVERVDLVVDARPGAGGRALSATNDGTEPVVIAYQEVALPAGVWRLRWRAVRDGGGEDLPIAARFVCVSGVEPARRLPETAPRVSEEQALRFALVSACPQGRIEVVLGPTDGFAVIDDVALAAEKRQAKARRRLTSVAGLPR